MPYSSTSGYKTVECQLQLKSKKFLSVLAFYVGLPCPLLLIVCFSLCLLSRREALGGGNTPTPTPGLGPPTFLAFRWPGQSLDCTLAKWLPWGLDVGVPLGALLSLRVPVSGLRLLSVLLGLENASPSSAGSPAPASGGRPPPRPGQQSQKEQHVHQVGWAPSPAAEWENGGGASGRSGAGRCAEGAGGGGRACQPGKVRGPHSPRSSHRPAGSVARTAAAAHPHWRAGLRCPDGPVRRWVRGSAPRPGGTKAGAGGWRRDQGQSCGSPSH